MFRRLHAEVKNSVKEAVDKLGWDQPGKYLLKNLHVLIWETCLLL